MKPNIYRRSIFSFFAVCLVLSLLAVGASAASVMRPDYNRSADIADDTADENGMVGDDNTSAAGTGEFGDDTSNTMNDTSDMPDTSADTSKNDTSDTRDNVGNRVENAVSDVVDGAENAVEDMTGGMSMWSIVLIIAIIAAIVVLVLVFFTRRK